MQTEKFWSDVVEKQFFQQFLRKEKIFSPKKTFLFCKR